jgi:hypothetical protein
MDEVHEKRLMNSGYGRPLQGCIRNMLMKMMILMYRVG